jgi:hypothetical protein
MKTSSNGRQLTILTVEYLLRGKLEENSEEISSVALLIPACVT